MIKITAYLRTPEELAKWKNIPNKTEWLALHLDGSTVVSSSDVTMSKSNPSMLKTVSFDRSELGFCKNGHPLPNGRDKCLQKGCKYN